MSCSTDVEMGKTGCDDDDASGDDVGCGESNLTFLGMFASIVGGVCGSIIGKSGDVVSDGAFGVTGGDCCGE